jgi:hypothetical protein
VGENFLYVFKAAASGRSVRSAGISAPAADALGAEPRPAQEDHRIARSPTSAVVQQRWAVAARGEAVLFTITGS